MQCHSATTRGTWQYFRVSRSPRNAALRPAASVKIPSGIWNAPTLQDMIEEAFWTLGSHRTCICPSFLAFTSSISCSARVELITNSSLAWGNFGGWPHLARPARRPQSCAELSANSCECRTCQPGGNVFLCLQIMRCPCLPHMLPLTVTTLQYQEPTRTHNQTHHPSTVARHHPRPLCCRLTSRRNGQKGEAVTASCCRICSPTPH